MPGNVNDKTPWTEIVTKTSKVFFFIGFCDISRYTSDVFGGIFVQGAQTKIRAGVILQGISSYFLADPHI
jgi:hypothetical protein